MMRTVKVRWEIDVDVEADASAEEAARLAHETYFRQDHSATVFTVAEIDPDLGIEWFEEVDLTNGELPDNDSGYVAWDDEKEFA